MTQSPLLAIVVPAYKARFLAETLRSVAAQTDQRFRLYVCDDGSPENLEAIFRSSAVPGNSVFHRFDQNAGGRSLTGSWARSVALSDEPWVWLFSDDDLMDPECVAGFHRALAQDGDAFNVYRFNTLVIDGEGRVIRIHPPNPERETVEEFIYHRLTRQRLSTAPEHIFRRSAYEARGGFVDLPFGLGSDDATWINLAGEDTPLRGICGPRVCWRLSGSNISSFASGYADKVSGMLTYAAWLYQRAGADGLRSIDGHPTVFERRELVRQWALNLMHRAPHFFTPGEAASLARTADEKLDIPRWTTWWFLLRNNIFFLTDLTKRLVMAGVR